MKLLEKSDAAPGKREAEGSAEEGEQKTLGQELADHASSGSAEGGADGDFALAASGPSEEKIRNVHAGDQQHKADRSEKRPKDWADVANEVVLERSEADSSSRVFRGVLAEEIF